MNNAQMPKAASGVHVTPVGDELMVHVTGSAETHLLSPSTATIWRRCDGQTSVDDLASEFAEHPTEHRYELVQAALDQLESAGLVVDAGGSTAVERESRRRFLKKAALAAIAVPTITTIVTATPAAAVSAGEPCGSDADCNDGLFCNAGTGLCEAERANGAACTRSGQCSSGCCKSNGNAGNGKDTCRTGPASGVQCYGA